MSGRTNFRGGLLSVGSNFHKTCKSIYQMHLTSYRRTTYAYNDSGDRTTLEKWTGTPGNWTQYGTTASYTYDGAGRMTAAAGVNYCYDANGNQTRRNGSNCTTGGDVFGWDAWHRMASANISGGSNTTYTSNGDGVRTKKTVGSTVTEYFQDVAGDLPRVAADKTGTTWNYYVYGTSLIGKVGSDNVARYYHHDGTGHVRAITDSTGTVVERYDYDAFGALRNTPTGISNDRRFTGEQHDAETAYTFLRARYYDPALGRVISKDPFKGVKNDPQTLNRYIYTANNPVNKIDRSGKTAMDLRGRSCPSRALDCGLGGGGGIPIGPIIMGGLLYYWDDIAGAFVQIGEGLDELGTMLSDRSDAERNPAQDHRLTDGEIQRLEEKTGRTAEEIKEDTLGGSPRVGGYELYKDPDGNILVKPRGGIGEGEPTGYNINEP